MSINFEHLDQRSLNPSFILANRVDTTSTADTIYVGWAMPGTLTSAASWRIKKVNTSSGAVTTWASGTIEFNKIWDNRTSLTYS